MSEPLTCQTCDSALAIVREQTSDTGTHQFVWSCTLGHWWIQDARGWVPTDPDAVIPVEPVAPEEIAE